MKVVYSKHITDEMRERPYLSRHLIEDALRSPDQIIAGRDGTLVAHKVVGSKLLRVVFDVREGIFIVITAYITKIERYMKGG